MLCPPRKKWTVYIIRIYFEVLYTSTIINAVPFCIFKTTSVLVRPAKRRLYRAPPDPPRPRHARLTWQHKALLTEGTGLNANLGERGASKGAVPGRRYGGGSTKRWKSQHERLFDLRVSTAAAASATDVLPCINSRCMVDRWAGASGCAASSIPGI